MQSCTLLTRNSVSYNVKRLESSEPHTFNCRFLYLILASTFSLNCLHFSLSLTRVTVALTYWSTWEKTTLLKGLVKYLFNETYWTYCCSFLVLVALVLIFVVLNLFSLSLLSPHVWTMKTWENSFSMWCRYINELSNYYLLNKWHRF